MSTSRLLRVQQARDQIKLKDEIRAASASSSSPSSSSAAAAMAVDGGAEEEQVEAVLQAGSFYAFSFESGYEIGQVLTLKNKKKETMMETEQLLVDAKELGVSVVCAWFKETSGRRFVQDVVDPTPYPSLCCLGDADLKLVDVEGKIYEFSDPARHSELQIMNGLAQPKQVAAAAAKATAAANEAVAEERSKRRRENALLNAHEAEGADMVRGEVERQPGKRRATKAVVGGGS